MQLIEFSNGNMILNWGHLPEKIALDIKLRDKILNELKTMYGSETIVDSKLLFEMNKYVINKIKNEKKECLLLDKLSNS